MNGVAETAMVASIEAYASIGAVILLATFVAGVMLILAHTIGPKRHGPVKDSPYECGMPVIGDTHRRFNVRFYMVALLFLLFDVEIVLLWPWALAFHKACTENATYQIADAMVGKGFLLAGMGMFFTLLVLGLLYEWKKGAFRWD